MSLSIIVAGDRAVAKTRFKCVGAYYALWVISKESHNAERRGSLTCCRTSSIPGIQIPAKAEPNGIPQARFLRRFGSILGSSPVNNPIAGR